MTAYIGRLAPSPTGLLHLGHAATFYAAFARARDHAGTLLLRNEDLDPERSRLEFVSAMLEDIAWLGIAWQPAMLSQSTRLAAYRASFHALLRTGLVYPCTCSRRDLAQDLARSLHAPHHEDPALVLDPMAVALDPADDEPVYDNCCRPPQPTPIENFTPANYRFRVPDGETIRFLDRNLGPKSFTAGRDFGDFLIWRRPLTRTPQTSGAPGDATPQTSGAPGASPLGTWDTTIGLPSYQLACVVDDAFQQITEVVRGADLLKSTARQIILQRALGIATPAYFHTALLRDEHGVRLAKRHDALALRTLRERGLTPTDVLARIAAAP